MWKAEVSEGPVQHTVGVEDQTPRIDACQVARPQRQENEHEEECSHPRRGDSGHEVGEREGDNGIGDRDGRRHPDRPERDLAIRRFMDDRAEVGPRQHVCELAGEGVDAPESRYEENRERCEVKDEHPAEWRKEKRDRAQPRPPPQCCGQTTAGRSRSTRRFIRLRRQPLMSVQAADHLL
jgi:hypothetical protein